MKSMKRMRHILVTLLLAVLPIPLLSCGAAKKAEISLFAMDTYMTLVAYGDQAEAALIQASGAINELEQRLSRTRESSEIWQINHGNKSITQETLFLLENALFFSAETDGAFDVTIAPLVDLWSINSDTPHVPSQAEIDEVLPLVGAEHIVFGLSDVTRSTYDRLFLDEGCAIDLGGIAKGHAADKVADILAANSVADAIVSLGGNVYVRGRRPDGKLWAVAVQDPRSDGYACTLSLTDTFAVTSGGYQRYFTAEDGTVYQHILDPATGYPARSDLLSATVVCPSGTRADAYSTALYVMGEEKSLRFWKEKRNTFHAFEAILITVDGRIVCTPGLTDHFTAQEDTSYEVQFFHP